jgi:hypothetical protein
MMHVLCASCIELHGPSGERQIRPRSASISGEPAEYERVLRGIALTPQSTQRYILVNDTKKDLPLDYYNCDLCNAQIRPGEPCGTWTVWTDATGPIPAWEHEYLRVIADQSIWGGVKDVTGL